MTVLGVLFNRYTHLVYGVCLKYLKHREDCQDAVIQIFEILIQEVPKHDIKNFKNWLYGVTRNYCLMQLRKQNANKKSFEKYSATFFMESSEELHPIDIERDNSINTSLKKCLEKLKEEQRKCVILFYFEEMCYKKIAEERQLEEKKIKSYIQNGKRNLKLCIEDS
ncbi:sigma-70 family RNA polymerase sigma factor [Flavicella sp.]|uniref:RNA polymerase sigma factor n=1 Tax=Flavicella sp. TaxID=2957742 RepID=UPI0030165504